MNKLQRISWAAISTLAALVLLPTASLAAEGEQTPRFRIDGTSVYLDMDGAYIGLSEKNGEILPDENVLGGIIFEVPEIDTVYLTGNGGSAYSADLMTRSIMRAKLKTVAHHECLSACAIVFLGGVERHLAKGAILGFHRAGTNVGALEEYYHSARIEKGWTNEFLYAEWNFQAGQIHARDMLELILENGISPQLAVRMLSLDKEDMWRPTEAELVELKVITASNHMTK